MVGPSNASYIRQTLSCQSTIRLKVGDEYLSAIWVGWIAPLLSFSLLPLGECEAEDSDDPPLPPLADCLGALRLWA